MFSCEFCKISKNTFFHRAPLVAASVNHDLIMTFFSKWTMWIAPSPEAATWGVLWKKVFLKISQNSQLNIWTTASASLQRCSDNEIWSVNRTSWKIFFLKNYQTMSWGDPLWKNQNWAYFWISSPNFFTVCFYCMSKSRTTKIYYNEGTNHLRLPHTKLFQKRSLELVSRPHFLHDV